MSSSSSSSSGGIGFFGALAILFIALKLTGYIAWPWWIVLSPIWGSIAFFLVVLGIVVVVYLIVESRKDRESKRLQDRKNRLTKELHDSEQYRRLLQ